MREARGGRGPQDPRVTSWREPRFRGATSLRTRTRSHSSTLARGSTKSRPSLGRASRASPTTQRGQQGPMCAPGRETHRDRWEPHPTVAHPRGTEAEAGGKWGPRWPTPPPKFRERRPGEGGAAGRRSPGRSGVAGRRCAQPTDVAGTRLHTQDTRSSPPRGRGAMRRASCPTAQSAEEGGPQAWRRRAPTMGDRGAVQRGRAEQRREAAAEKHRYRRAVSADRARRKPQGQEQGSQPAEERRCGRRAGRVPQDHRSRRRP